MWNPLAPQFLRTYLFSWLVTLRENILSEQRQWPLPCAGLARTVQTSPSHLCLHPFMSLSLSTQVHLEIALAKKTCSCHVAKSNGHIFLFLFGWPLLETSNEDEQSFSKCFPLVATPHLCVVFFLRLLLSFLCSQLLKECNK